MIFLIKKIYLKIFLDADLWTEAVVIPGSKGMPVQLKFETKDLNGNVNQNLYTVFQLRSSLDISIDELLVIEFFSVFLV